MTEPGAGHVRVCDWSERNPPIPPMTVTVHGIDTLDQMVAVTIALKAMATEHGLTISTIRPWPPVDVPVDGTAVILPAPGTPTLLYPALEDEREPDPPDEPDEHEARAASDHWERNYWGDT